MPSAGGWSARSGVVSRSRCPRARLTARVMGTRGTSTRSRSPRGRCRRPRGRRVHAARGRSGSDTGIAGKANPFISRIFLETRFETHLVPTARESPVVHVPNDEPGAEHVAALAFVLADAVDRDPSLFLAGRGCTPAAPFDLWRAGALPAPRSAALPTGAVPPPAGAASAPAASTSPTRSDARTRPSRRHGPTRHDPRVDQRVEPRNAEASVTSARARASTKRSAGARRRPPTTSSSSRRAAWSSRS